MSTFETATNSNPSKAAVALPVTVAKTPQPLTSSEYEPSPNGGPANWLRRLVAVLVVASVLVGGAAASPSTVRWFHSPSGNIECEVASHDLRGTYAFCETLEPPQTARLTANGRTAVCVHHACPIGNGPVNATTLPYGRSLRVGIFRCTSALTGIRCSVIASGHGFRIAREGVVTF